jgi:hypothetical protein
MSCSLAPAVEAAAMAPADDLADRPCARAAIDVAGRAGLTLPDTGISRALSLPRARAEGDLAFGALAEARLAVVAVRSGGTTGYIGVDGEALVLELQLAEARAQWRPWGLAVGAGVVADPWVGGCDEAWSLRPIAPSLGESLGWFDSSDMGAWLGWSSPERIVAARLDVTSGEGARFRERNEGKDVSATVSVRPLRAERAALSLSAYGREGSRGLGLARDHRLGLRLSGTMGPLLLGVEGLAAWGVDGQSDRTPIAASGWTVLRPLGPLLAYGRLDVSSEELGNEDAGARTILAGAGVELPAGEGAPLRVVVGYSGTRVGSAVSQVAGAESLDDADTIFLQLGVSFAVPGG